MFLFLVSTIYFHQLGRSTECLPHVLRLFDGTPVAVGLR